jgi:hypothetical protein
MASSVIGDVMRKACGFVCVVALAVAACGGSGSGSTDPASVDSCEDLVDVEINIINAMIGEMSDWPEERIRELIDTGGFPEELARYEDLLDEYSDRADALECDWEQIAAWECERVGRISVSNAAGRTIRENLDEFCRDLE